jgi:hypothetical protein
MFKFCSWYYPTFITGILPEIGLIKQFDSEESLAKYVGITWSVKEYDPFQSEDIPATKTGNSFLRYYIIETAQMTILHNLVYDKYYHKKYNKVKTHQHTHAITLTARKLIKLIYRLMSKNQFYKK